jgi:EmrB/QacA subfamily drug resistance transporter
MSRAQAAAEAVPDSDAVPNAAIVSGAGVSGALAPPDASPAAGVVPGASLVAGEGAPPAGRVVTRQERRRVLAAAMVVTALASMDGNIVGPALPRIVSDLGGLAHLSWVVTAFSVASTAATPIYGWLSDKLGRKLAFTVSICVFLGGSVLCGDAHSMVWLIAARALQGIGAGGLITLAQTAIGDVLSPRERPKFQGWIASVFAICSVAGPLLGGTVTDYLSWPWIFYLNLPVGFAALAMILAGPRHDRTAVTRGFDAAGFALVIFATCAFLLALSWGGTSYAWDSPQILALLVSTAIAITALFFVEARAAEPALPPRLFADPVIGRTILSLSLAVMGMFGSLVFVPLFFQLVHGASATEAGLRTAPIMGGLILASIFGGRAVARLGRTKPFILGGMAISALALAALAGSVQAGVGSNGFDALLVVLGAGMGLVMPNMTTTIQNAARAGELGVAMATTSFFRSLGGAFGVALAGMMLTVTLRAHAAMGGGNMMNAGVQALQSLPAAERGLVIGAYGSAVALIFAVFAGVLVLALVATALTPEVALRKTLRSAA